MHTGRCNCGKVRYEFSGEPTDASFCHCSICRRLTGSAFGAWYEAPGEGFNLQGGEHLSAYRATERLEIRFCRVCGATVLATHSSWPESRYIPLGTLDRDAEIVPEYHQFVGSKAAWFEIHDSLRQYDTWPDGE